MTTLNKLATALASIRSVSYDLMVFEPGAAPKDHDAFLQWYATVTKWDDGPYNDLARTSPRLRAWVQGMQRSFPDMNTPEADTQLGSDEDLLADYTIGPQFVYAGFAWSKAVAAAIEAQRFATTHKLGFFDISSDAQDVWLPVNGTLHLAHSKKRTVV